MKHRKLYLPHFKIEDDKIVFLKQYNYLELNRHKCDKRIFDKILIDEGICVFPKEFNDTRKNGSKVLIIEPHLDDCALSASSLLLKMLSRGDEVAVINVFSKGSIDSFPWKNKVKISHSEYEDLRLLESNFAFKSYLNIGFKSLRMKLASTRGHLSNYVFSFNEDDLIHLIAQKISRVIIDQKISSIMGPMAIQGHIDHIVTFRAIIDALRIVGDKKVGLILYEDIPYSRNKFAFKSRVDYITKHLELTPFYIPVKRYIDTMADLAIIYRSQFDDINRSQMKAIIEQDCRATSSEWKINSNYEFAKRFYNARISYEN